MSTNANDQPRLETDRLGTADNDDITMSVLLVRTLLKDKAPTRDALRMLCMAMIGMLTASRDTGENYTIEDVTEFMEMLSERFELFCQTLEGEDV